MRPPVTPESSGWLRPLGATRLNVSALAAGGGPLGGMPDLFGYDTPHERAVGIVRDILSSPVRVIDTANGYSNGKSEERIGAALRDAGSTGEGLLVATKVDAKDGDYSGRRVVDSVAESRARLGLDHLPLVYLHDPEFHPDAGFERPGGAVETLVRLRDEGVIGHLGVAGGHTPTMERMLDLGISLADAAIQHSLRDERIDMTVVGFSKTDRLRRLLAATRTPIPDEFWVRASELLPPPDLWLDHP